MRYKICQRKDIKEYVVFAASVLFTAAILFDNIPSALAAIILFLSSIEIEAVK